VALAGTLHVFYLKELELCSGLKLACFCQINVFLNRLNGEPIGISVFRIFVIDKNTILAVCL